MRNSLKPSRHQSCRGSTIALVLVFAVAIGVVIAAALQRAATEARLNKSDLLYNEARLAAESALQHGMAQVRRRFERTQQLLVTDLHPSNRPIVLGDSFYTFQGQNRINSHLLLPSGEYDPTEFSSHPTAVLGQVVNQNAIIAQIDPMSPIPDSNSATIDALVREVRLYAKATTEDPRLGQRTAYLAKTFQILDLSLFQYAVFYNHDFELWPGADMNLGEGGPIHVNGDAYLGANSHLNVHSRITASGNFYARRHPQYGSNPTPSSNIKLRDMNAGDSSSSYLKKLTDASPGASHLDSTTLNFADLARQNYNGGLMTTEHNIDHVHPAGLNAFTELFPPGSGITGNHAHNLIRPVDNLNKIEDPSLTPNQKEVVNTIEDIKWSNKAKLTMELSLAGGTPEFQVYTYEYDDDKIRYDFDGTPIKVPVAVPEALEFWEVETYSATGTDKASSNVTSGLYDYRQGGGDYNKSSGKINLVKLDVDKMRQWVESSDPAEFNPDWWNGVVYVKMPEVPDAGREDRVVPAVSNWATQLVNGKKIPNRTIDPEPVRGMTLATNGPLYVRGDFNNPENSNSTSSSGTPSQFGNAGKEAPAALIADAITILSNNWNNANSAKAVNTAARTASPQTVVSAALVTGLVPSKSGKYSGGLENFPRFLETWDNSRKLIYRGSMVSLFRSESHKAAWGEGDVYTAPQRAWGFHKGFRELPPPGDPGGRIYRQISFKEMSREEFEAATNAILSGSGGS